MGNKRPTIKNRYGYWIVIKDVGIIKKKTYQSHYVLVQCCKCNRTLIRELNSLNSGKSTACNKCSDREHFKGTHRKSYTSTYKSWAMMKQRCYNPNLKRYKDWGGRGIRVCKHWLDSFENFLKDMGECPKGLTLERIDNDGNYEPSNCKWATYKEQANNRNNKRKII